MKKYMPLIVNFLFLVALYFGFFQHVEGAKNIALFYIWINIVVALLYFHKNAKAPESTGQYIKLPKFIKISIVVLTTFVLVWSAYWVTAVLYSLAMGVFIMKMENKQEAKAPTP